MVQVRPTLLSCSRTRNGRSKSFYCSIFAKSMEEDTSPCTLRTPGLRVFPPRSAGAMMLDQPEIDGTLGDAPQVGSKILGDLGDTPQAGSKILGDLGDTPQAGSKILGDLGDTPQAGSKTLGDFWESSSKDQALPAEEMIERSEDDKEEDLKTSTSVTDADLQ